jgi:CSLREA domain-containing protein
VQHAFLRKFSSSVLALAALGIGVVAPSAHAATFTVNSANDADDGLCDAVHCSLREAINRANTAAGQDTINFSIAGTAPHTIQPTTALPTITDKVNIEAI